MFKSGRRLESPISIPTPMPRVCSPAGGVVPQLGSDCISWLSVNSSTTIQWLETLRELRQFKD